MKRSITVSLAVAVAGLAVGGCGPDDEKASATTTTITVPSARLEKLIPTTVLAGYEVQGEDAGYSGPMDLEDTASSDGGDDAKAVLQELGFVRGYHRYWQKGSDDNGIFVDLSEFKNTAGAEGYDERGHKQIADYGKDHPLEEFVVSEIPDAWGASESSGGATEMVIQFTRGSYVSRVGIFGVDASEDAVRKLALEQYGLLGGA